MADDFKYDVFISYSHRDEKWVVDTLLLELENAGLKVCIDFRDFIPGKPSRHNMRDACKESKYTVLVMTPAWMASEWTEFEGLLSFLHDPSGKHQRTIPILLEKCQTPEDIQIFTYIDFTRTDRVEIAWKQLLSSLGAQLEARISKTTDLTPIKASSNQKPSVRFEPLNNNRFIETINAHHIIELFRNIINPDSYHRILFVEGEEKIGKTHLVTKVFPILSHHDYDYSCVVVDLRNKFQSTCDILSQISAQLRININLEDFNFAYEEWIRNPSISKDWSTYLTTKLVSGLQRENQKRILVVFDQLDDANEEIQRWLREALLVQLFLLQNIRIVVSGRHVLSPSSAYHHVSQIYKLELIEDQDEYINYCRRLGVGDELADQSIRDFARFVGYRPGLFAELLWATFIK